MYKLTLLALVGVLACGLLLPVSAAELDCDEVYCFSGGDFSEEPSLAGICLTDLPENGTLLLGNRILVPGDILTAEQVAQMTFAPLRSEVDQVAQVGYLPVFDSHVAQEAVMTLSIRGKEDKAPAAEDFALETYQNLPNTGVLKAKDPEGQSLTYTVTRQPKRGSLEVREDGSFTYTPKKNKIGVDSFVYTATDPAGNVSRLATVTITILKPTQAPQYTDTAGKECRFAAEWMKHTGIFVGENLADNPCFSPEKTVTKGEFITMLVKALEIPTEEDLPTGFADEILQWLQPYLAAAVRSGLTADLPEQDVFGANDPITGEEAAAILQNALDEKTAETFALSEETLTRAEVAQVIYETARASR